LILPGDDADRSLKRNVCLAFEHVSPPNLDQRTVAEQSDVLRSGRRVGDVDLYFQGSSRHASALGVCYGEAQLRLASILLRDVSGGDRFAGKKIRQQSRMEVLVKENLHGRDVERVRRKSPEYLIPSAG
jgi:hypothetical protein